MDQSFLDKLYLAHRTCTECPSPAIVAQFFEDLLSTLFPDFAEKPFRDREELQLHLDELKLQLEQILCKNRAIGMPDNEQVAAAFMQSLPQVYTRLNQDVQAMYEGDPAAKSLHEVVRTYPGFYAIAAYRIAHELRKTGIQLIPRMITEYAHSKTGIDIHPSAQIGEHFCIDHGTGVVIGETAIIGNHVKLYQGVTLGALSVRKEDAEKKRHPTLENHVVVYAGATILGGDTVIGHHSTIGGNVWLTRSVAPYTKVYYQAQMYNTDTGSIDLVVYKTQP